MTEGGGEHGDLLARRRRLWRCDGRARRRRRRRLCRRLVQGELLLHTELSRARCKNASTDSE